MLYRQLFLQFQRGEFGRLGGYVAPPVGDSMDVDVNADARLAAGDPEHQIRTLGADAVERHQHIVVTGQISVILFYGTTGDSVNLARFRFVESDIAYEVVDFLPR
jgi:hypothetical protein